jgi:predicted DNA repair protein MutK
MKTLSVAGTAAMFLVGGGILVHGLPAVHHWLEALAQNAGSVLGALVQPVGGALFGIVAGAVVLAVVAGAKKLFGKR